MTDDNNQNLKNFSFTVSEKIYQKIDNHVRVLKQNDDEIKSKKTWIEKAVREKLKREKEISPQNIPKEKYLSFKIEHDLGTEIERRVGMIRNFRDSYSKKAWILDAILEQMDHEGSTTRKILEDLNKV